MKINIWTILTYVIAFVLAYVVIEQLKKMSLKGGIKASENLSISTATELPPTRDVINSEPMTMGRQIIYT